MASSGNGSAFRRHPQFLKMKERGVDDNLAYLAMTVFEDLCGSPEWSDVELDYSAEQRRTFVTGHWNDDKTKTTVVPLSIGEEISFSTISRFLNLGKETESLILALCEGDSTIVYYNLAKGIRTISRTGADNCTTASKRLRINAAGEQMDTLNRDGEAGNSS